MRTLDRLTTELKTKSEELRQMELRRSDMVRGRSPLDTEGGRLSTAEAALAEQLVSARAKRFSSLLLASASGALGIGDSGTAAASRATGTR